MLVSQSQLSFTVDLIKQFERRSSHMRRRVELEAQYIAIVAYLRATGHVFRKVDCDTNAKLEWGDNRWPELKKALIFTSFIEYNRNKLLKEFSGGLSLKNEAFGAPAFFFDPSTREEVVEVADFDASKLKDEDGKLILSQFYEAVDFWDKFLREAEEAFRLMDSSPNTFWT